MRKRLVKLIEHLSKVRQNNSMNSTPANDSLIAGTFDPTEAQAFWRREIQQESESVRKRAKPKGQLDGVLTLGGDGGTFTVWEVVSSSGDLNYTTDKNKLGLDYSGSEDFVEQGLSNSWDGALFSVIPTELLPHLLVVELSPVYQCWVELVLASMWLRLVPRTDQGEFDIVPVRDQKRRFALILDVGLTIPGISRLQWLHGRSRVSGVKQLIDKIKLKYQAQGEQGVSSINWKIVVSRTQAELVADGSDPYLMGFFDVPEVGSRRRPTLLGGDLLRTVFYQGSKDFHVDVREGETHDHTELHQRPTHR